MIELGKPQSSIVKQIPETLHFSLKLATAAAVFILIMFLQAGKVDEIHVARPIQEDAVPVYTHIPEDEQIDYEEFLNRLPLRKPAPKPRWLDWFSETPRRGVFS